MALTDEQRMDRRIAKRREARMAGDALKEAGESSDLSSNEAGDADGLEGFRNHLERRMGTEEYERVGARGHDDPDSKGRYSAAEVKSEFRNRAKGTKVNEGEGSMTDYFQGLVNDGAKFNNRAKEYLIGQGVTFGGGGGGGGEDPITEEPELVDPPAPPEKQPLPKPQPDTPPPIYTGPGSGGGNTQVVDNHAINNQQNIVYGNNSSITANNDQSVVATQGGSDYASRWYRSNPYLMNMLGR